RVEQSARGVVLASMTETYAAPSGPPPTRNNVSAPARQDSFDVAIPDEPPPAYTPSAGMQGDTHIQAGPSRMDFSGPPPLPERLEQNITGVGVGYGPRPPIPPGQGSGWAQPSPQQQFQHQPQPPHTHSPWGPPEPPPQHPSRVNGSGNGYGAAPSTLLTPVGNHGNPFADTAQAHAGPSRPSPAPNSPQGASQQDLTPTEVPTPGRPLLRGGQLLVYPKGYVCSKCGNTGYKNNDPSNPCSNDWRKYGKPYNSALAHSYTISGPTLNPSTTASSNFQRPLPSFHAPYSSPPPQQNPYAHLPPPPSQKPPGSWNTYPGQGFRPPPPPPPHMQMPPPHQQPGPIFVQHTPGPVPHGSVVVQPGDPRIGGR
ncbi:hypothetical protein JCM24511_07635, partial [Saitozyma sp. JCM 24511]